MERGKRIVEMLLRPSVAAYALAIEAIRQADAICIGPGSFYTSVIPNFLPDGIKTAFAETSVPVIFIANLLTEGRGMEDATVSSMVSIIESHIGRPLSKVIMNNAKPGDDLIAKYTCEGKHLLPIGDAPALGDRVMSVPIWSDREIARHDSDKLAQLVYALAGSLI